MTLQDHIEDIEQRFWAGETLQEIGDKYGCTRERVRQLLNRRGVSATTGGVVVRRAREHAQHIAEIERRRAERIQRWFGLTLAEYDVIRVIRPSPTRAYTNQRKSARTRKIGWKLTFKEWWAIWEQSGKWSQRGKGHGKYCMARINFTGPYQVGNVHIMTTVGAAADYWIWL